MVSVIGSRSTEMNKSQEARLARWRLILGKYARDQIPAPMSLQQERIEKALDFLYSREYRGRGVRDQEEETGRREGTLDPSQLTVPHWLNEVRELFPKETVTLIEKHALDR